jgi:hypothetical protein
MVLFINLGFLAKLPIFRFSSCSSSLAICISCLVCFVCVSLGRSQGAKVIRRLLILCSTFMVVFWLFFFGKVVGRSGFCWRAAIFLLCFLPLLLYLLSFFYANIHSSRVWLAAVLVPSRCDLVIPLVYLIVERAVAESWCRWFLFSM